MNRRIIFRTLFGATFTLTLSVNARAADMDATSQAAFDTVMTFMGAIGSGDMETATDLMADDMVWMNEDDSAMLWSQRKVLQRSKR